MIGCAFFMLSLFMELAEQLVENGRDEIVHAWFHIYNSMRNAKYFVASCNEHLSKGFVNPHRDMEHCKPPWENTRDEKKNCSLGGGGGTGGSRIPSRGFDPGYLSTQEL